MYGRGEGHRAFLLLCMIRSEKIGQQAPLWALFSECTCSPGNNGGGGNPIYAVNYVNFCKFLKKWRKFR